MYMVVLCLWYAHNRWACNSTQLRSQEQPAASRATLRSSTKYVSEWFEWMWAHMVILLHCTLDGQNIYGYRQTRHRRDNSWMGKIKTYNWFHHAIGPHIMLTIRKNHCFSDPYCSQMYGNRIAIDFVHWFDHTTEFLTQRNSSSDEFKHISTQLLYKIVSEVAMQQFSQTIMKIISILTKVVKDCILYVEPVTFFRYW